MSNGSCRLCGSIMCRCEWTRLGVRKCEADPWLDKTITRHEDGTGMIDPRIGRGEINTMRSGYSAWARTPS
ncbi:hypothetical protein J6TS7_61460 [Paenibacillus dendritiformis]|nr:hypothetical protein J6TS7_61460 [Paenibacillus dendritiformis]